MRGNIFYQSKGGGGGGGGLLLKERIDRANSCLCKFFPPANPFPLRVAVCERDFPIRVVSLGGISNLF